jgi:hypothetical protein
MEYETLNPIRGKRRDDELLRLAEEEKDFEYRRLFIEEAEQDILVSYSRSKLCEDIALLVLFIHALSIFKEGPLFGISLIFAFILWSISVFYKYQHQKFLKRTRNTLLFVDAVIESTYGITLPKYL